MYFYSMNILIVVMVGPIKDGNFYIKQRKVHESNLQKKESVGSGLQIKEGYKNYSRTEQKKMSNKFDIPSGLDPGQMVMCQTNKARYVKLIGKAGTSKGNMFGFQQIEVYDENNKNIALSNNNYTNDYTLEDGHCATSMIASPNGPIQLLGQDHGSVTSQQCEKMCNDDNTCSGFQIENETSSEGLNKCKTYNYSGIKGDGSKDYTCRVRQRRQGDSVVTSSSVLYPRADIYAPVNGNIDTNVSWINNTYVSYPNLNDSIWMLDLKKDVNVKQVKIYFNKQLNTLLPEQNKVTLQVLDKNHNILTSNKLSSDIKQSFEIDITGSNCGGPVIEKNTNELEKLKTIQDAYNRELQEYNQSIKNLMENSKLYVHATNNSTNRAHNNWVRDEKTGSIGYVTSRGVYKELPDLAMGNEIQGNNKCPGNYTQAQTVSVNSGQIQSLSSAPYNEILETNVGPIIKGDPMISNQSCSNAGENIYITKPAKATGASYKGCNKTSGQIQKDMGKTSIPACRQRAEDRGVNTFQMGPNESGRAWCYLGDGSSGTYEDGTSTCPTNSSGRRFGKHVPERFVEPKHKTFFNFLPQLVDAYDTYATYTISGANRSNLGKTYHVTDDLKTKMYPDNLLTSDGDSFEFAGNFDSGGNDIVSGTGLSLEQVKAKCINTPGAAGFVMSNDGTYHIKNNKMWPVGNRQMNSNLQLYVRNKTVKNNKSCSNIVNFSTQEQSVGYMNTGEMMSPNTLCSLGIISDRDMELVKSQYAKLQSILSTMRTKIDEISKEDSSMNEQLMNEYNLLQINLNKYEKTYKEIRDVHRLSKHTSALYEDSTLQMNSRSSKFIIWSILALSTAYITMKYIR